MKGILISRRLFFYVLFIIILQTNRNIYIPVAIYLYHMLQNYTRYKILQEFFDSPRKNFQMREISRNTKITQPSVINHLKALINEGYIIKENKGIYPSYIANRDNEKFRTHKKINILLRLYDSKLIDLISNTCFPKVIILFGSASIGEDIEQSDLDLFVDSKPKELHLEKYEKILKRRINILYEENFNKISKELKNNIINGIIIKGYLKVF